MPSLHVAFACLVALFIGTKLRTRWRWLLVLYPLAMGFALVYLGEHYVVDLIAGFAVRPGGAPGMNRWEAWRRARTGSAYGRATLADGTPLRLDDTDDLAPVS